MWIARDKDNTLCIYSEKPSRKEEHFRCSDNSRAIFRDLFFRDVHDCIEINEDLFQEVTRENSPKELIIR